jgi:DNA-binding NtrC family response regulator
VTGLKSEKSKVDLQDMQSFSKTPKSASGQPRNILLVEDDPGIARLLLECCAKKGVHADLAGDKKTALDLLDKNIYNLVFTNLNLRPGSDLPLNDLAGLTILAHIKSNFPNLPVIMIANHHPEDGRPYQNLVSLAVQAVHSGCSDFLTTPLDKQKIQTLLDTLLPQNPVCSYACLQQDEKHLYSIVGRSPRLLQTLNLAAKIAPTSAPVLISGESGTGKELIAHLVHQLSDRADKPYIKVNCAALTESLLESELFGHEKGAFTGALNRRKGRFEMADGGTLLLDEISETPLAFQAKLLRVLEQQCFERVGGNDNVDVDVRIISTTNKDLSALVQQGKFRLDLYYRLGSLRLLIPPLRERPEDLFDLSWHFVNLFAPQTKRNIQKLDPDMMRIFENYNWPGNIRQLRNVIITSLVFGIGQTLSLADVSWLFDQLAPLPQQTNAPSQQLAPEMENTPAPQACLAGIPLVQVEKQAILDTLRQTAGNQSKAAKILGISDRTLREKVRKYRTRTNCQLSAVSTP